MKRYLIRAGFDPSYHYSAKDYLFNARHIIGTNSGNLLFAYGVMNALKTPDAELDFIYEVDKPELTDAEVSLINEKYDAFIIPMADAFRKDYMNQLIWYTRLIKRLKIPVVVIGIGLRSPYEPNFEQSFVFDDVVKDFVCSVLDHSSMLGLRGEITGKYLSKLGFKEDRDFTPIGCPSLYTYGDSFTSRNTPTVEEIRNGNLIFNVNVYINYMYMDLVSEFIQNSIHVLKNHVLIQQTSYEFKDMYIGDNLDNGTYCKTIFEESVFLQMKKEDRVKFFMDVPSWIDFCKDFTLFIGYRFHGCVAAILSGIPYVFLPFDSRTRELADFHHLTKIHPQELKKGSTILDYVERLDFNSMEKHHHNNFMHYLSFLNSNGLDTIFSKIHNYSFGESPLEQTVVKSSPIRCFEALSEEDKKMRITSVNKWKEELS